MSMVASFVRECARNGRWVRGVLALHGSLHSEEEDIVDARIRLANTVLDKHWLTALSMVKASDVSQVNLMCRFLYACSKNINVPSRVFANVTATFLKCTKEISETQNSLFISAIMWTPWVQAIIFFGLLKSPQKRSIRELTEWLKCSRTLADSRKRKSIDSILLQLGSLENNPINYVGKGYFLSKHVIQSMKVELQRQDELSIALNSLRTEELMSMKSVVSLAKAVMRGESVSWKLPLSLVAGHQIVEDSNEVLAKMIGFCCPRLWCAALVHFRLEETLALWLASCHSWRAGLSLFHFVSLPQRKKYDILSRSAIPLSSLRKITLVSGAKKRIPMPTKRSIASELAKGYVLEELQLSAFAKACQRGGNWESAIHLFNRVPTQEFQRRAIQCLLGSCPWITVKQLLYLVSEHHPANSSTASVLIEHSSDWVEALYVLRYVMARGTQCNPQVLSAFMDVQPPVDIVSVVLERLRSVVNKGILSRFRCLEREKGEKEGKEWNNVPKP